MSLLGQAASRWATRRWWVVVLVTATTVLWRTARAMWRHREGPILAVLTVALWFVMLELRTRPRVAVLGLLLVACMFWSYFQPGSGRRWILERWRQFAVYRRDWHPAMTLAGLSHGTELPRLRRVEVDGAHDLVHLSMLPGQIPEDFKARGDRLARVFGATACTVYEVGGRDPRLVLELTVPGRAPRNAPTEGW